MMTHDEIAEWLRWGWLFVADHLWQTLLFTAFAFVASALLRTGPARLRSAVWLVALAKLALPIALFAWIGAESGLAAASVESSSETSLVWALVEPSSVAAPVEVERAPLATGHDETFCILTALWLAGVMASAGFWWAQRRRVALAVRAGRLAAAARERDALSRAQRALGVSRPIDLVVSPGVDEPGVWRAWRPVLVMPEGIGDELDDAELEAVMMHEVAHVARRDNVAGALQTALRVLLWFHPAVWLVDRMLLAERERACDEAVLEAGGGAHAYAKGLLKVFRFSIGWRPAGVSCATGSHLGRRIEQIMVSNNDLSMKLWHRAVIALVVTVMAGLSATAAAYSGSGQEKRVQRDVFVKHAGEAPDQSALVAAAAAAPLERVVAVDNSAGGPVTISDAQIKLVPAETLASTFGAPGGVGMNAKRVIRVEKGDTLAEVKGAPEERARMQVRRFPEADENGNSRVLVVTLQNTSGQAIEAFQFGGSTDAGEKQQMRFFFHKQIAPGATETLVLPVGGEMLASPDLTLRLLGAHLADGTTWGEVQFEKRIFVDRLPGAIEEAEIEVE